MTTFTCPCGRFQGKSLQGYTRHRSSGACTRTSSKTNHFTLANSSQAVQAHASNGNSNHTISDGQGMSVDNWDYDDVATTFEVTHEPQPLLEGQEDDFGQPREDLKPFASNSEFYCIDFLYRQARVSKQLMNCWINLVKSGSIPLSGVPNMTSSVKVYEMIDRIPFGEDMVRSL